MTDGDGGVLAAARGWLRRPLVAALVLLAAYALLSLLLDPGGTLGTDTGAKVGTLEVMDRRGTAEPDVGYWAEEWDPTGRVHPYYQAKQVEDGWVAVTTLPMLEAARPLYALGGYRTTLLLPMLGSVACAFVARGVARRAGADERDAWLAFWVVGLASPLTVYALDLWEHSIGAALVGAAALLLLDVADGRPWPGRALAAGAALGAAATMRTEALVYALVLVGAACAWRLRRDRTPLPAAGSGLLALAGFAVPWFANRALEEAVGGVSRAQRAAGTATSVGTGGVTTDVAGSELGARVREGLVTLVGFKNDTFGGVLLGAGMVVLVLVAARMEGRGEAGIARLVLVAVGAVLALSMLANPAFLPGMLIAFPLVIGLLVQRSAGAPRIVVLALAALPIVWAFQYLGGAGPQWGGRYTLTSALLLGAAASAGLLGSRRPVWSRGLLALSMLVTALGVGWLGYRTHRVADFFERLEDVPADVVVVRNGFLLREAGAELVGQRWLSTDNEGDFVHAMEVAADSGAGTVAVLEFDGPAPPDESVPAGFEEVDRRVLTFIGTPVGVVRYQAPP